MVVCELSRALHQHMELLRQIGQLQPTLLPNLEPPPGSQSLLHTGKQDSLFQLDPQPPSLKHHGKLRSKGRSSGPPRGKSFTAPFPPCCTEVGTPWTGPVGGEPREREPREAGAGPLGDSREQTQLGSTTSPHTRG